MTVPMEMNKGFRERAPTSEMYAIVCPLWKSTRMRLSDVAHVINMASSMANHTTAEIVGRSQ